MPVVEMAIARIALYERITATPPTSVTPHPPLQIPTAEISLLIVGQNFSQKIPFE